jgi:hypothetical protein
VELESCFEGILTSTDIHGHSYRRSPSVGDQGGQASHLPTRIPTPASASSNRRETRRPEMVVMRTCQ